MLIAVGPVGLAIGWSPPLPAAAIHATEPRLSLSDRLAFIRHAQIWTPLDVSSRDLRAGPEGAGAFVPNALVPCDYVEKKLPGTSRKFACAVAPDAVVKVRYGAENGEVEGQVLASRLLWALGFGADRVYPVRVICHGCPRDPWNDHARITGAVQIFDPAAIEEKPHGHEMRDQNRTAGWSWSELDQVDEAGGGASRAERDALKLLAVLMQHTDTKPEQQRLLCLPDGLTAQGCEKPFLILHDVGLTFGRANHFNAGSTGSVNFDAWSEIPIWKDPARCVGHLSRSMTGTLGDPVISEAGRAFLAHLLTELTDRQLHDLFEVARVDRRSRRPGSSAPPASIDEWVAAFKQKRDAIVNHHCAA